MKILKELWISFRVFCNPFCWLRNNVTDFEWNVELKELMKVYKFRSTGIKEKVILGDTTIWVGNHPYASFTPISRSVDLVDILPSRHTAVRAMDQMKKDLAEEKKAYES